MKHTFTIPYYPPMWCIVGSLSLLLLVISLHMPEKKEPFSNKSGIEALLKSIDSPEKFIYLGVDYLKRVV